MIKLKFLFVLLLTFTFLTSCSKDESSPTEQSVEGCGAGKLCFEFNGQEISVNATWREINPQRYRIYWEESEGNNYKNIEIDIYGNSDGTYTIDGSGSAGTSGFQYYLNVNNSATIWTGVSGTLSLTISNNQLTGTFTGSLNNGTESKEITNGTFEAISKQ